MAVGNFREDAATQAALNKQKQYIDKNGNFKAPFRKAGESYWKYQKRVKQAQLESGLFPRLEHSSTLTDRTNKRQYLSIQKEIEKLEANLANIEAAKGTEREYSMSLGKDKAVKRLNQLKLKQENNPYKETLAIQESKELLAKNSQQQTAQVAENIASGTANEQQITSANANAFANGAETAQFSVDQFKEYNPDLQYLHRTQDQNVAYDKGDIEVGTDLKRTDAHPDFRKKDEGIENKLKRAKLFVKRHASGKNSVALQRAKLYIREHEG